MLQRHAQRRQGGDSLGNTKQRPIWKAETYLIPRCEGVSSDVGPIDEAFARQTDQ